MEKQTKYIKVDPKNQLEGKEYIQMHPIMIKNRVEQRNDFPELEWVEEVPDHEEEMKALLEELHGMFSDNADMMGEYAELYENKIRRLLHKSTLKTESND